MSEVRDGEVRIDLTEAADAALRFIGVIHTPWSDRKECPRQGRIDGPECRVEIFDPWVPALAGLEAFASIELFYWLDRSRRDLVVQVPRHSGQPSGTFALRSPVRPNPIGLSRVKLERIEGNVLVVRGLDCLDGTPLVDIKPDRCDFSAKD
ncbi:tRNA (N6-threonylcarbamoyladenosine(37)-N6)-methyltransferase TrmO [Albibacillus kandeliae]|uniref:tRNA (N6-threonylcarbamoyladenosine(37)-N6)-methyltransferase TrmO n=1 Tax=Albibacillus kandeliae TaxID=2174228 RepID=UPI000D689E47|nr:tRNA (N6-threonylcarbamoyladenosine(37)-N6)-methyltransferase TrmO [Albibacillus kandeliae]